MSSHLTSEQGRYVAVPTAMPLCMELYVMKGETLQTAYRDLRAKLELDDNYKQNASHCALYGHLAAKPAPKDMGASDSRK